MFRDHFGPAIHAVAPMPDTRPSQLDLFKNDHMDDVLVSGISPAEAGEETLMVTFMQGPFRMDAPRGSD
jgi:hypothetical protein